jgi:hypothetical protein
MLTDEQADEIRREVESGTRGPILVRWVEQLLDDRTERVRRERERSTPPPRLPDPAGE